MAEPSDQIFVSAAYRDDRSIAWVLVTYDVDPGPWALGRSGSTLLVWCGGWDTPDQPLSTEDFD